LTDNPAANKSIIRKSPFKLEVASRTEAVTLALRNRIIP